MGNLPRRGRIAGVLFASALTALCVWAPPASAEQRYWSADPRDSQGRYPSNWHCDTSAYLDACLINSHNGTQPVYRSVMIVKNNTNAGIQLSAAVINMWAVAGSSKQVRDDGCHNSGLSSWYAAACYGSPATLSAVCSAAPGATHVTANAAVNIDGWRDSEASYPVPVNC